MNKTSRPDTARNWLVAARVPGITFALAALLLPTAAAGALAPDTLDTTLLEPQVVPTADTTQPTPADLAADRAEARASAPSSSPSDTGGHATGRLPFTTGQKLTPEEIAWFQAEAEGLRAQGLLRGHAVWSH